VSAVVANPYLPWEAEVIEHIAEAPNIVTLRLRLTDAELHDAYRFNPGQFNMMYLYGVGEVPISIVSDPEDEDSLDHTIRAVGRVTRALVRLETGDRIGIRGPYGRGWPMQAAQGKDIVIVTGGLGCAPVMSVINYVLKRREAFGRLTILQGVRHSDDLIWRQHYERWAAMPDTAVHLAADVGGHNWPYSVGTVIVLLERAELDPDNSIVMMCGPERMMKASAQTLMGRGFAPESLWLSLERNMQCGIGHCGHCQYGPLFVCHDGPVFHYPQIASLFGRTGF
jgi:NAD(P)H-flavin reductase